MRLGQLGVWLSIVAGTMVLGYPACAQADDQWNLDPSVWFADGPFSARLSGLLMVDFGHISDKYDKQSTSDVQLRKFGLVLDGTLWDDFRFKAEGVVVDDDDLQLEEAYVQYAGFRPLQITVGNMKTPNGLENFSDLRNLTLVEPNSFSEGYGFEHKLGVSLTWLDEFVRADVGFYEGGPSLDKAGIKSDSHGYAIAGRFATFPEFWDTRLHLGASILYRNYGNPSASNFVRYRLRPLSRISKLYYNDTLELSVGGDLFFGVEVAAFHGPFFWESEYGWLRLNDLQIKGDFRQPRSTYEGGYLGLGWFITGEERGYRQGALVRTNVLRPVFQGGWGAWMVNIRIDYVELVGDATHQYGGEQLGYIAGLNWYINDHVVVKFNYQRSEVRDALDLRNPVTGESNVVDQLARNSINTFMVRLQVF
ncbi:porin [Iodidimonas sp. SYSU 1G8]|uniref:OprO/OprP family phosphate-selective porin n=1 Tax=Iodidimonas sp. SYSU 1G8 TaxID=3133967 RepID=UPI0031FEE01E